MFLQLLCPASNVFGLLAVPLLGVCQGDSHGNVDGGRGEERRRVLVHFRVEEGELEQILGQKEVDAVRFGDLGVPLEETEG